MPTPESIVDYIGSELDGALDRDDAEYASELAKVMLSLHRGCQKMSTAIKSKSKSDRDAFLRELDTYLLEAADRWNILSDSAQKGERDAAK